MNSDVFAATISVAVIAAISTFSTHVSAQPRAGVSKGISIPDRSVTTQSDATSLEVNPAGLGFIESAEMRYGFEFARVGQEDEYLDQHGAYLAAGSELLGGGIALQWLDRPVAGLGRTTYQKLTLGSAIRPADSLSAGLDLNVFNSLESRRLDRLKTIDVGLQLRPSRFLGFGVSFKDANSPHLGPDLALPMRMKSGTAVRLVGGKFILGSEIGWTPTRGTLFGTSRVVLEPVNGIRAFARLGAPVNSLARDRSDIGFRGSTGVELSLGHVGLAAAGAGRATLDGDTAFTSNSQQIWISPQPRRSFVAPVGRWIQIDLTGSVTERALDTPFAPASTGLLDVLTDLRDAADDPRVDGVILQIDGTNLGYAQAWEIRQQIEHLNSSGIPTVSYLKQPDFLGTYLASAADRVWVLPSTPYEPEGIRVTTNNYGEALSKAGIEAEFVRIGKYKSAPEAFVRRSPSKPALKQTKALVEDLHSEVVQSIASDRDLKPKAFRRAVDQIPIYPAEATRRDLVDHVVYPDELRGRLREKFGAVQISDGNYDSTPAPTQGWEGGPIVAVLYVDGSIVRGKSADAPLIGSNLSGSKTISDTLDQLRKDPRIRALVIRIDSPGGSAVASDLIYRKLRRVAAEKPVVASMGNVAASGGYYVAAGADTVFATPTTLTGSIGIFAGKFNVEKLTSWLGVNHNAVQRGSRAGRYDLFSPWSAEQRKSVAKSIEYLYRLFLEQVSRTRPLDAEALDDRARGRVWSGSAAKEQKLVDKVGGLLDAIRHAEKKADLAPGTARYQTYPRLSSLLDLPDGSIKVIEKVRKALDSRKHVQPKAAVRDTALRSLVERLAHSVRLPLVYAQGEPLMLPPQAIRIHTE